nr:RNA-directed DNA polymerase, eukaryota, reverse transcriptase zinc-binding domain protein [Tanacetum cinerariifolium]
MVVSILSRIVVAATSYYISHERKGRLFKKKSSTLDQIVQVILSMVVSAFISKCCQREAFTRASAQYKEYVSESWYTLKTLEKSKIQKWITRLIWEDIIHKLNKKTREKVVPYPRFISLLLEYMIFDYDDENLTLNPPQFFIVLNWVLKPNQPEGPPFIYHMLAICNLDVPVENKAPNTSSHDEMKAGDPTSLGVASEEGAHPQLSSGMFAYYHNIFFDSTTFHSESRSGYDASIDFTVEADPGKSAPNDFIPQEQGMEIKLPEDLKDIPTKLETFASIVSSLTSQVTELKTLQCELLAEILALPSQILLNASHKAKGKGVPLAGPSTTSPAEGEKNTNPAKKDAETTNLHNELVDILGIDTVTRYYNKKLLYEKYCDKMLKRRKSSKIINCNILTQKSPITLQVYREDGSIEVIPNVKTRMEYLNQTKKELKIDFNKPLREQDPMDELNDLASKKRKRANDLKDHSRPTKKNKSPVQLEEEVY